jgi:mannose-6-phosphate isomerase-like protein (cupin superfamily)
MRTPVDGALRQRGPGKFTWASVEMQMEFVRPVDFDGAPVNLPGGYRGQFLYHGERCSVIATTVPPGVAGPPKHIHPTSDQLYFVTEGEITIKLGSETRKVGRNSLIFIPSGVPHCNWNEGGDTEVHLEVIAPTPLPTQPIAKPSDSDDAGGLPYYVREADPSKFGGGAFAQDWLLDRESGSRHMGLYVAEVPAGAEGPPLHYHAFDQFYFVLSGALHVQIGLTIFQVAPNHLVVLPAGVPHRQWNEGAVAEHHLAILAPLPEHRSSAERPWDVAVALEASHEVIA